MHVSDTMYGWIYFIDLQVNLKSTLSTKIIHKFSVIYDIVLSLNSFINTFYLNQSDQII